MRLAVSRDCGPEMRTIPTPPRPGGVDMAAIVFEFCTGYDGSGLSNYPFALTP